MTNVQELTQTKTSLMERLRDENEALKTARKGHKAASGKAKDAGTRLQTTARAASKGEGFNLVGAKTGNEVTTPEFESSQVSRNLVVVTQRSHSANVQNRDLLQKAHEEAEAESQRTWTDVKDAIKRCKAIEDKITKIDSKLRKSSLS